MSQRVYNLIILDESGSMSIIEKQTISGFNETIQTISAAQRKHEGQRHFVSLVVFNSDSIRTVFDKVSVDVVSELTMRPIVRIAVLLCMMQWEWH